MKPQGRKKYLQNALFIPRLALLLVLLVVGGIIAYTLYREHGYIEQRERERLDTQAKVIDENLARQLDGVYRALEGIRREMPLWQGKSGMKLSNRHLRAMADAMPGIRTFLITDPSGTITASNRDQVIGQNIRYREYFQAPLKGRNLSTLYISPPFRTILGNFVINAALVIPGHKGEFAGVVSAALDPEYFNILLGSVLYTPDMWAALAHGDGRQFLMVPEQRGMAGLDLARPGSFFTRHRDSGLPATVFTGTVSATGEERLMAMRTISPGNVPMDKPLVVAVSRDLSAVYADWRREAYGNGGLFVVLVLAMTFSLHFYQLRQRKFEAISAGYESAQRDNAERLKMATEAAGVGVWDYDLENGRLTWDSAMFTIFGQEPAGFSSLYGDWRDTVLPEDLCEAETALQSAINGGKSFNTSFRIRRRDGEVRTIRGVARVHRSETGKPVRVIGINEDITERQQEAEELLQAKEAAVSANLDKSRFLSTVAHEFRTPLSLLTSSTDILDRYGERLNREERTQQHDRIRNAARQMSSLVDTVLSFNRLESKSPLNNPVEMDVGRFCHCLAEEVGTTCCSGQTFNVSIADDCGTALMDEVLFRRIVENLLTNAFRYTPADGTISLHVNRENTRLRVAVTDSGIGIPKEDQKRIFDAFYRCRNVETRRGLGLGLSIVHDALLRMDGTITVGSTIGEGTTMCVEIPVFVQSDPEEQMPCTQS